MTPQMTLVRLYAWSCAVALPIVLGLAIAYLYLDGRIGMAAAVTATFAIVAIIAAAITLQEDDEHAEHSLGNRDAAH